jgi:predicted ATPase
MTLNGEPDQTHVPGSFVGRARELAELHAGLEGAVAGRGGSFLISGEPGIGKTRLAEEVAATARARGTRVLWGRCWEGGGAPAYWPWIQVIRGCLGAADLAERRSVLESEHASAVVETVGQLVPELYATAGRAGKPPVTSRLDPE